jgi:hypothetical protein
MQNGSYIWGYRRQSIGVGIMNLQGASSVGRQMCISSNATRGLVLES